MNIVVKHFLQQHRTFRSLGLPQLQWYNELILLYYYTALCKKVGTTPFLCLYLLQARWKPQEVLTSYIVHRSPTWASLSCCSCYCFVASTSLLTGNLLCICFDKIFLLFITMHYLLYTTSPTAPPQCSQWPVNFSVRALCDTPWQLTSHPGWALARR